MAGFKTFAHLEHLTAEDLNGYVMGQVVARFPDATARDAAIGEPEAGQLCHLADTGLMIYDDTGAGAWLRLVAIPAGGTTGQVLAKASNDDYDIEWVTP